MNLTKKIFTTEKHETMFKEHCFITSYCKNQIQLEERGC